MSASRSHRFRVRAARATLLLATTASACLVMTACQAPVSVLPTGYTGGQHTPSHQPGASDSPTTSSDPQPTTSVVAPTGAPTTSTTTPTTTTPPPADDADPNPNCTLIVPPAPLSAAGLATPYRFLATDPGAGACHEANADQSAFVEASILDPATGALSVYHPLVIDDGTQPALAPVRPALPTGAVVGVWFGFQADNLTLRVRHFRRGVMNLRYRAGDPCVNGTPGSEFTQFAYCGAPRFFAAANAAIRAGKLTVPALGTGSDGQPCPTTRDFSVVDQDQSDNLPGSYLATADGRIAQFSAANSAALPGATVLNNASDNGLVDNLLDPVLGCHPATAPDLAAAGSPSSSLALNELQAAADQAAPVALVPPNDPMTLVNGNISIVKTNLYRIGVDQVPVNPATDTGANYCTEMAQVAVPRLALDEPLTAASPSPDPAVASDLHGFLVSRLNGSWGNLGCPALTGEATPADAAGTTSATPAASGTMPPTTDAPTTDATAATVTATADPAGVVSTSDPAGVIPTDDPAGLTPTTDPVATAPTSSTATSATRSSTSGS